MSEEDPVRWSDTAPPPELLALVRDASRPPPLPPALRASVRASVLRAARPRPLRPPFVAGLTVVVIVAIGIVIWRVLPIGPEDRSALPASESSVTETNTRARDEAAPTEIAHAPAERVVLGDEGARAVARRVGGEAPLAIEPAPARREPSEAEPGAIEAVAPREAHERAQALGRVERPPWAGVGTVVCDPWSGECERRESSAPPAAPRGWGTLTVMTMPWTRVFIDGRDTGRNTPVQGLRVPAGRHRLGLRDPDGAMHTVEIEVVAGQRHRIVRQL